MPRFPAALLMFALLLGAPAARAADPASAVYSLDESRVFWFVQVTDSHVGQNWSGGSQDTVNLDWVVEAAQQVIEPRFVVLTGDITDHTDGGWIPTWRECETDEWDEYLATLDGRADPTWWFDLPGNHDAYSDDDLSCYRGGSIQGRARNATQVAWTLNFPFGSYLFAGLATPGEDGAGWPSDNANLAGWELDWLDDQLEANSQAGLIFLFGHHPLENMGVGYLSGDDRDRLVATMRQHRVSGYGFGHSHENLLEFHDGTLWSNTASLGKSDAGNLTLWTVDSNGVNVRHRAIGGWPLVQVTAPVDVRLGGGNPYAYPAALAADNPVRAVAFDRRGITRVEFRVAGGEWQPMVEVGDHLYQGVWDTRGASAGDRAIEVRATGGSGSATDAVTVALRTTQCNDGADNDGNGRRDWPDDIGCESPADDREFSDNRAPVAEAGADIFVEPGSLVRFDGSDSYDPDPGDSLAFAWDFDAQDGIQRDAEGVIATFRYPIGGAYTVTLIVEDDRGGRGTDTLIVNVCPLNNCGVCGPDVPGIGNGCGECGHLACGPDGLSSWCDDPRLNPCGLCGGPPLPLLGEECESRDGCPGEYVCNTAGDGAVCNAPLKNQCDLCGGQDLPDIGRPCLGINSCLGVWVCSWDGRDRYCDVPADCEPVDGDFIPDGDMPVDGDTAPDGDPAADGDATIDGDSATDGDTAADGDMTVDGDATADGDTTIDGDSATDGDTPADGETAIDGDTTLDGDTTTDGDTPTDGDTGVDGDGAEAVEQRPAAHDAGCGGGQPGGLALLLLVLPLLRRRNGRGPDVN